MSWSAWAALTKYHRLGGCNNRYLFSHSSGGGKCEIRVPGWSDSTENALPLADGHLLTVFTWPFLCMVMKREFSSSSSSSSSDKATCPIGLGPYPHDLVITFQMPHSHVQSRWGGAVGQQGFRTLNLGETQFSQSIQYLANCYSVYCAQFLVVFGGSVI